MPSSTPIGRVTPSLFDRLTDLEPRVKMDPPVASWEQIQDLKRAIATDLTNLLNVRRSEQDIPEEFEQANRSIAAYGIQDFSASPVDAGQVRRAIEKCIRTFEPRLSQVSVQMSPPSPFQFEFRISAVLRVDLYNEQVSFDAIVPTHSRRFQVSEGR